MLPPVEYAKRINRTWIVNGNLAQNATRYLEHVEKAQPSMLEEICERAVQAARLASHEGRDPKPDFYAALFSRSTPEEQETYLKEHLWTRRQLQQ